MPLLFITLATNIIPVFYIYFSEQANILSNLPNWHISFIIPLQSELTWITQTDNLSSLHKAMKLLLILSSFSGFSNNRFQMANEWLAMYFKVRTFNFMVFLWYFCPNIKNSILQCQIHRRKHILVQWMKHMKKIVLTNMILKSQVRIHIFRYQI